MNQKVQHVITLPTNLQTSLYPVQPSCLEELGGFELSEQVLLGHRFLWPRLELVQNITLQQLLV